VTAFLIEEMFPATAAGLLRDKYGHDAVHVTEAGLRGAPDTQVAAAARADSRAVVTENVADFLRRTRHRARFVLKRSLPAGGAQAPALAAVLDRWNHEHPDPYLGPHWPRID
jgi:hypothetical protein